MSKMGYRLGIWANFDQKSIWQILIWERKVSKMGQFWPKSKAIGLVFGPILTKNQFGRF